MVLIYIYIYIYIYILHKRKVPGAEEEAVFDTAIVSTSAMALIGTHLKCSEDERT